MIGLLLTPHGQGAEVVGELIAGVELLNCKLNAKQTLKVEETEENVPPPKKKIIKSWLHAARLQP